MSNQKEVVVDVSIIDERGQTHKAGKCPVMIHQNEDFGVLTISELVLHIPSLSSIQSNKVVLDQEAYLETLEATALQILGLDGNDENHNTRKRNFVLYRHILSFFMYHTSTLTTGRIGKRLGGKDHASVLHGARRILTLLESDKKTYQIVEHFTEAMSQLGYNQPKNTFKAKTAKMNKLWK